MEEPPLFDKLWNGTTITALCAGLIGALVWVGRELRKENSKMTLAQWFGGFIVSIFTGWAAANLLSLTGLDPYLVATLGSAIGSTGSRGYDWIVERARGQLPRE